MNTEESKKLLLDIASHLEVNLKSEDIVEINMYSQKNNITNINFELKEEELCQNIIEKRKNKEFIMDSNKEIKVYDSMRHLERNERAQYSKGKIYINEQLTKYNLELFKKAKLLRGFGYKFIWHRFGKIFVRKNSKVAHARQIFSLDAIDII